MTDIVSPEQRSLMMSGIKSKNTKPEILVRSWLHANGYRYRLHPVSLPGKPDIVLKKWNTVVMINGCFFHHHEACRLAYIPKTRTDWWLSKFQRNMERDREVEASLLSLGWRVLILWECQTRSGEYTRILSEHFDSIGKEGQT